MTRPRKCRMVGFVPDNPCFHPQLHSKDEVVLSIEEIEAIRLSDYLEMEQDSAAESMNISRGTFQRIINAARKKMADALVNGKIIRIDGGNYQLLSGKACCRRHSGLCKRKSCEKCEDCEENELK
jgi:Predicted DNA-binding proteins